MPKKNEANKGGLVYSTNPDVNLPREEEEQEETLPKAQQKLRVHVETKHRGGKVATIVTGFIGTDEDLELLGKMLKTKCGTGGSVKDGEVIIQGNCKEKLLEFLKKDGYSNSK